LLELSEQRGHLKDRPRLSAYLTRMRQRPAYKSAMDRGGKQDLSVFRKPVLLT
jgi:glutathione S-transferase